MVVVDAGNALFRVPGVGDEAARARAAFVLGSMGKLGTFAIAAGERDMNLGTDFLRATAEKAKVKVLSANLLGKDGKPLFPASAVATLNGVKVGFIGATRPGPVMAAPGVQGGPVVEPVLAAAKKLRPSVDLLVVLAAVPRPDALQLASEAKESVDLIIHSHEGRGPGPAQRGESSFLVPAGERGRHVGRLDLSLSGKGAFVDLKELEREKQMVEMVSSQIATVSKRLVAATDDKVRQELKASLATLEASKKSHQQAAASGAGARTLKLEWLALGPEVKDDPQLKAEVEKIEPPGRASD
ncbi:MAG: 5'-nucleotidase [Myxococcales bacterium]|nr:5'-nucleotidase [Myxococcales bacterium]